MVKEMQLFHKKTKISIHVAFACSEMSHTLSEKFAGKFFEYSITDLHLGHMFLR